MDGKLKSRNEICDVVSDIFILILLNNAKKKPTYKDSVFNSTFKKDCDFGKFLKRIVYYTECEEFTLIYSLALVDYFCKETKFALKENNYVMLFVAAFYISMKINEDVIVSEKEYAKICSIRHEKLLCLEATFLETLNYKVSLSPSCIEKYANLLKD